MLTHGWSIPFFYFASSHEANALWIFFLLGLILQARCQQKLIIVVQKIMYFGKRESPTCRLSGTQMLLLVVLYRTAHCMVRNSRPKPVIRLRRWSKSTKKNRKLTGTLRDVKGNRTQNITCTRSILFTGWSNKKSRKREITSGTNPFSLPALKNQTFMPPHSRVHLFIFFSNYTVRGQTKQSIKATSNT